MLLLTSCLAACLVAASFLIYELKSEKSKRPFSVEESQFTFCAVLLEEEKLPKSSYFLVLVGLSVIPAPRLPPAL